MTKDVTIRELYELIEPLVDDLGDCEVLVRYDGGTTFTPIKKVLPYLQEKMYGLPPQPDKVVVLEGY